MMDLETGIDASVVARRLRAADRPGPAGAARAVVDARPGERGLMALPPAASPVAPRLTAVWLPVIWIMAP